jgi:cell division protein FtsB
MDTAKFKELADEYAQFQNVKEEEMELKDHIQLYESLVDKIEKAGLSFYEISRYVFMTKMS